MPRKKNTARRMEIVNVAFRLFMEHGYSDVQMKEIAEAAGISKSLLQHYFPKKVVLLSAMLNEIMLNTFKYGDMKLEGLSAEQRTMIEMSYSLRLLDENPALERFFGEIFNSKELTTELIIIILDWLDSVGIHAEPQLLRYSLNFALSGGMAVFFKRHLLNATPEIISQNTAEAFFLILGRDWKEIDQVYLSTAKYNTDKHFREFIDSWKNYSQIDLEMFE